MEERFIEFNFKARYHQLGRLDDSTKNLIFVLHGYGQLAKFFLKKFSILNNGSNCIIAPEGLSKFYLEGFSGRVGATWMTKEAREIDIKNYITYLNTLYLSFQHQINKNTKVTIIGFSQGSATVSRWIASNVINFNQLILWAGIFPPDMDFDTVSDILNGKEVTYIYGTKDPFITKERLIEMAELSKKLKVNPNIMKFEGDHTIDSDLLTEIFLNNG